jgi:hypothetical protein
MRQCASQSSRVCHPNLTLPGGDEHSSMAITGEHFLCFSSNSDCFSLLTGELLSHLSKVNGGFNTQQNTH